MTKVIADQSQFKESSQAVKPLHLPSDTEISDQISLALLTLSERMAGLPLGSNTAASLQSRLQELPKDVEKKEVAEFVQEMAVILDDPMQRAHFFQALNQLIRENYEVQDDWELVDPDSAVDIAGDDTSQRLTRMEKFLGTLKGMYSNSAPFMQLSQDLTSSDSPQQGGAVFAGVVVLGALFKLMRRHEETPEKLAIGVIMPKTADEWNTRINQMVDELYRGNQGQFPYRVRQTVEGLVFEDLMEMKGEPEKQSAWKRFKAFFSRKTAEKTLKTLENFQETKSVKETKAVYTILVFLFVPMAILLPAWIAAAAAVGLAGLYFSGRALKNYVDKRRGLATVIPKAGSVEKNVRDTVRDYLMMREQFAQQKEKLSTQYAEQQEKLQKASGLEPQLVDVAHSVDHTLTMNAYQNFHNKRSWVGGKIGQASVIGLLFMATAFIVSSASVDIAIQAFALVGMTLAPWALITLFAVVATAVIVGLAVSKYLSTKNTMEAMAEKEDKLYFCHALMDQKQKLQTLNAEKDAKIEANNALLPEQLQVQKLSAIQLIQSQRIQEPKHSLADRLLRGVSWMLEGSTMVPKILRTLTIVGLFSSIVFVFPAPILFSIIGAGVIVLGMAKIYHSYKEQQQLEDKTFAENIELKIDNAKHDIILQEQRLKLSSTLLEQQEKCLEQYQQQQDKEEQEQLRRYEVVELHPELVLEKAAVASDSLKPSLPEALAPELSVGAMGR